MALTDTKIKASKPKDKAYKLYDEAGLFLIVTPSGGKWWRFKYVFNGKEKLLSLGTYPEVPIAGYWHDPQTKKHWIDGARDKRNKARELVASGMDPSEVRKIHKSTQSENATNTFEFIARVWLKGYSSNLSPATAEKNLRLFERDLFPWIGNRPIAELKPKEILDTARRIEARGAVDTAKRAIQLCGQVFQQAVIDEKVMSDPTRDIRRAIKPLKDKHFASLTDPKDVAELLRAIDAFKGSFVVMSAIRLAPLVFVRPVELRKAKWRDIDLKAKEWRYLVTKTNTDHLVPLSNQAVDILKELHPLTGSGEYVFQVGNDPKKPMSDGTINAALKRMGYDTKTQITGHGFRAMARTILHERLSIDPHIIEHQLAHAVPDNLGGAYNRTKFIEQRVLMMQQWADYLDELKDGAKIIPFKQA
ncbi:MAG: integrase [Betaproteobacteria bacterium HGW-Betaproteobacteria-22]|nr:MAG: integrase [Betaproteobacteria bacterium HGW-Betaproteobacteria-22]